MRFLSFLFLAIFVQPAKAEDMGREATVRLNQDRELRQASTETFKQLPSGCIPNGIQAQAPRNVIAEATIERFGDTARLTIWRESCANNNEDSAVMLRISPRVGNIFICSSQFDVVQGGVQFDSVRLINVLGGSSFCDDVLLEQNFAMDQWNFDTNFDEDEAFTLFFDGSTSSSQFSISKYETAAPAPATNRLSLEEPADGSVMSGISNLRGWAVSSEGVDTVELFIDGQYAFEVPYGGRRTDVGGSFPEIANSDQSGFGQTFNYNDLSRGAHRFTVRLTTQQGAVVERSSTFSVVNFGEAFISDPNFPDLSDAQVSIDKNGVITIQGIVTASGENYLARLVWSRATQGFEIIEAFR